MIFLFCSVCKTLKNYSVICIWWPRADICFFQFRILFILLLFYVFIFFYFSILFYSSSFFLVFLFMSFSNFSQRFFFLRFFSLFFFFGFISFRFVFWNEIKLLYDKHLPYDKRPVENATSPFSIFLLFQF